MKNSTNAEKKKGLGALDVIIILALVACVIAAGFAFVFERTTAETVVTEKDFEEYVISFEIYGMRQSSAQMLTPGDMFYTSESDDFGVMNDNITITPAVVYLQDSEGNYIKTYAPENGDYTKVDVSGTFTVKGVRDSKGFFLLNGETQLIPNKSIIVRTDMVEANINITDIEKVSG